ncbi:pirin family protein [Mucilaginibacter sp. KACC 22063]|uniref:pirin family protein n=1 Tax=Mucilaginibacter sp. KACC 22063 TaxID=3025666 RepID=UPI0023659C70|nr:hypothetical protein [Mucilaginibacter sp. KACC 22063]WDF54191.1 hypothetical protein PQ461_14690 [Mucilaginibacter sp. KACC 22063]
MVTSPGRLYLADQRGLIQSSSLQQHCTFNYSSYIAGNREAIGALKVFNDSILAAGKSAFTGGNSASVIVLIPVTGSLVFKNDANETITIEVGQVLVDKLSEGGYFKVINPYQDDWINFYHFEFEITDAENTPSLFEFDFENETGKLIPITEDQNLSICIGHFNGRQEEAYHLQGKTYFYATVIAGAFEVEGRLLHQRDSLALWNVESVELEALSNHAVILILSF